MIELDKLSVSDLENLTRLELQNNPFFLIEQGLLMIKDKNRQRVKFVPNRSQQKVLDVVKREWFANRPVRVYILKARQQGISTLAEAILFSLCLVYDDFSSIVIADKVDNSEHLFDISKFYHNTISEEIAFLQYELESSNSRELKFRNNHSKMQIETAGAKRAGQSHTFQAIHCSEISTWQDAEETFLSINQTLPNKAQTIQIIETTANGVGNHAYNLWWTATEKMGSAESSIIPIFIAWWEHAEYSMQISKGVGFQPTAKELEITKKYKDMYDTKLTYNQLFWRRWCISNNCGGDERLFQQEYPGCPEEAFLASGNPVFDVDSLSRAYEYEFTQKENYMKYNVEDKHGKFTLQLGQNNGKDGDIDIYSMPVTNFKYLLTCDPAEGVKNGDYSVCNIFNVKSGEQVAHYSCRTDIDLFGMNVHRLAVIYNNALIVPERNNHGHALVTVLESIYQYSYIYKYSDDKLGFPTTTTSKVKAISELQRLLRENYFVLHNLKTIKELMSFVNNEGKMEAQTGCHDDEVSTLWMAGYVMARGLLGDVQTQVSANNTDNYKPLYYDVFRNRHMREKNANKTTGW